MATLRALAARLELLFPEDYSHVSHVVEQLKDMLAGTGLMRPEGTICAIDAVLRKSNSEPEGPPTTAFQTTIPSEGESALEIVLRMFFFRHAKMPPYSPLTSRSQSSCYIRRSISMSVVGEQG